VLSNIELIHVQIQPANICAPKQKASRSSESREKAEKQQNLIALGNAAQFAG
jgi:hypothetical protein